MTALVQQFYDEIANAYEFIFVDWEQSVKRQAQGLHNLLTQQNITPPSHILDCTCGIGTQTFALALAGYQVHGTDLSPQAIERAKQHTSRFELSYPPDFAVANLLEPPQTTTQYEVVLACDNAVAHFHDDATLRQVIQHMQAQLKPNGLLMISIRDYDSILKNRPTVTPVSVYERATGRHAIFQVWDWADDYSRYKMEMFIIRPDSKGAYQTTSSKTSLRAWQRAEITQILQAQGLHDLMWHMPETSGFYQPIVTARKP